MASSREAVSKDVHEAFRRTCYAYGIEELATLMGMSQGVLYNKANLQDHNHHKPTLQDAVLAQVVTDDKQITQAMAHLMGGVFIDLSGRSTRRTSS